MSSWQNESVFYHIFPLGFTGAPFQNDFVSEPINRISKVESWISHLKSIGVNVIYFSPLFESSSHGYDTADYTKIDRRLGTNADFRNVCSVLKRNNIKVVVDGVFNHVGRDFWAFKDVLKNRENSVYKNWFKIDFNRNNDYNDGLWYEGWEGHFALVTLNLENPEVKSYIFGVVKGWISEFDIDGLRLDVAYLLNKNFLRELRAFCKSIKPDFWIMGEIIYGDYKERVNSEMLDSCTNYEMYKPIYSSLNELNLFEIAHSIDRQFGEPSWTLYKGLHLYSFVDNHDVSRFYTILKEKEHIKSGYVLLYTIPCIPSIYYGSEFLIDGDKNKGDNDLRPCLELENLIHKHKFGFPEFISTLSTIYVNSSALKYGNYKQVYLTNTLFCFTRFCDDEQIFVIINISTNYQTFNISSYLSTGLNLLNNETIDFSNSIEVKPFEAMIVKKV